MSSGVSPSAQTASAAWVLFFLRCRRAVLQLTRLTVDVQQLKGTSLDNDNILGAPEDCKIEDFTLSGVGSSFNYTAPQYSVTVLRLHR